MNIYRCLTVFILTITAISINAQTAEEQRASAWLNLQALKFKQSYAPSYLTADEKAALTAGGITVGPTVCDMVGTNCLTTVLPVTGLELTGKRISAEKVQLNWETIAEFNNKGFVLERQSSINSNHFDSVTFTEGKGTSYQKSRYNYTDINGYPDQSFYRLKQIDIDGRFTYSNVVVIDGSKAGLTIQVMPNPGSSAAIGFYITGGSSSSLTSFTITNAAGMVLAKKEKIALAANNYISLSSYHLPKGFYYVSVIAGTETLTQKFIIQ